MPLELCATWASCHLNLVRTTCNSGWQEIRYQDLLLFIIKLRIQVSLIHCYIVWGHSMVMALGWYFCVIRGYSVSSPKGNPLYQILADWYRCRYDLILRRNWFSTVTLVGMCIL